MLDRLTPAFSLSLFQILCVLRGPFHPCACVEGEKDFISRISYIHMKELLLTLFQDFCLLLKPFNQWCTFMWNMKPWYLDSYPEEPFCRNGSHCLLSTKTDGTIYILFWNGMDLSCMGDTHQLFNTGPPWLIKKKERKKEKPLHLLIQCDACPGVLKKNKLCTMFSWTIKIRESTLESWIWFLEEEKRRRKRIKSESSTVS